MIPPLTLSQACCDALRPFVDSAVVWKCTCDGDGNWYRVPRVLVRTPDGRLSERRPTRNELDKVSK